MRNAMIQQSHNEECRERMIAEMKGDESENGYLKKAEARQQAQDVPEENAQQGERQELERSMPQGS